MPKPPRTSILGPVERELLRYFGQKRCVVTGGRATWHHLDENRARSEFPNLIPLDGHLNDMLGKAFEASQKGRLPVMDADLGPEALIRDAMSHYSKWDIARAYGCARLSVFVARDYLGRGESEVLSYAGTAFWFARHRLNYEILDDIISRDILPIAKRSSVLQSTATIKAIHELCTLLMECGEYDLADEVDRTLAELAATLRTTNDDPLRYAGIVRRQATTRLATEPTRGNVLAMLSDSRQAASSYHSAQLGADLGKAWACLEAEPATAHEVLKQARRTYMPKALSPGTDHVNPIQVPLGMMGELAFLYSMTLTVLKPTRWKSQLQHSLDAAGLFYSRGGNKVPKFFPPLSSSPRLASIAASLASKIRCPILRGGLPTPLRRKVVQTLHLLLQGSR